MPEPAALGVIGTPRRAALLAASVAAVVHLGALANGFAYDDNVLILGDPGLRQLAGLSERLMQPSWPAAFGEEIGAWRPVTTGTWALTWIVSGGSPVAFHALGVLLHAVVTGLGVLFLAEVAPLIVALLGGLVFAVHPVHVEAVANVAGSAELISAVLALAAIVVHVRGGPSYGVGRVLAVTALYALAVLAKEGAAVVPLLVLFVDQARRDDGLTKLKAYVRERAVLYLALGAALVVLLLLRWEVVGAVAAASHPPGAESLRTAPRSWTVFSTWPHVARLLFFPARLAADYAPAVIPVVFGWTTSAALGVVLAFTACLAALLAWRRGLPLTPAQASPRLVALGLLWIGAALLPVANVLYLGPVLVAERTLYLASWGAALLVAVAVVGVANARGSRTALLVAALVVASGAARSALRVPQWDSTDTIMSALIEDRPESGTGWMHLGRTLARQGRADDALTAFGYAVVLLNSEYRPATEIGAHLVSMGRFGSAVFFLERAWREHPEWPTAPGLLANAHLGAGRPDAAVPAARAAVGIQPENASLHHLLAQALSGIEAWPGAVAAREESIRRGFADRGRSWILLAAERANAGDTVGAWAALDSAALRALDSTDEAALDDLRARLGGSNLRPDGGA